MHRGVLIVAVAFGLAVSLCRGPAMPLVALAACAPRLGMFGGLRGDARESVAVALLVFALVAAALGVIVGIVGRAPFTAIAAGLLAAAVVVAASGAWLLPRRKLQCRE